MTDRATLHSLMDGWKPPVELARGRPRPTRLTLAGAIVVFLGWLFGAGALVGLITALAFDRLQALAALGLIPLAALFPWLVRRQRRLLEDGRPAPAIVTRLGQRTDKGRRVYYEFPRLNGARAKGRYGPVPNRKAPAVGATLVVLYDPDNPSHSAPYPLSLVRLAR